VIFCLANGRQPISLADMETIIFIPRNLREAGAQVRAALQTPMERLEKRAFVRVWSSVAYLFPGLHPDAFEEEENGWPRVLKRFAAEAWRRAENGELADDELYCSDAQWAGICDRLEWLTPEEFERRVKLKGI
jgi:hypothetical protein